jgi:hypothetical protein
MHLWCRRCCKNRLLQGDQSVIPHFCPWIDTLWDTVVGPRGASHYLLIPLKITQPQGQENLRGTYNVPVVLHRTTSVPSDFRKYYYTHTFPLLLASTTPNMGQLLVRCWTQKCRCCWSPEKSHISLPHSMHISPFRERLCWWALFKTRPKRAGSFGTNRQVKCRRCITKVVETKQGYTPIRKSWGESKIPWSNEFLQRDRGRHRY